MLSGLAAERQARDENELVRERVVWPEIDTTRVAREVDQETRDEPEKHAQGKHAPHLPFVELQEDDRSQEKKQDVDGQDAEVPGFVEQSCAVRDPLPWVRVEQAHIPPPGSPKVEFYRRDQPEEYEHLRAVQRTSPIHDPPSHGMCSREYALAFVDTARDEPRKEDETHGRCEEAERTKVRVTEPMEWTARKVVDSHEHETRSTEGIQQDDTAPPNSRGMQTRHTVNCSPHRGLPRAVTGRHTTFSS